MATFSFKILSNPAAIAISSVKPGVQGAWQRIDDCCWECDVTVNRAATLKYSLIYCLIVLLLGVAKIIQLGPQGVHLFFVMIIPFLIPGCLMALSSFLAPAKKLVLHRLEGTVSFPGYLLHKSRTVPFESITVGNGYASDPTSPLLTKYPGMFLPVHLPMADAQSAQSSWSTIVWYMDKNRPLPPGTAFDPYRTRDEERRRNEGNPPPRYPYTPDELHGEGEKAMEE